MCNIVGIRGRLLCRFCVVLSLGAGMSVSAREIVHLDNWTLTVWTAADGIPSNVVRGLAQTPDGFLWIGTFGGLSRFDGNQFKTFDVTNAPEMGGPRLTALDVDRTGTLWVGGLSGVISTLRDGKFSRIGKLDSQVNCLVVDHENVAWFGNRNGVFQVTGGQIEQVAKWRTQSLLLDDNHVLWGSGADGVFHIRGRVGEMWRGGDSSKGQRFMIPLPSGDLGVLGPKGLLRVPNGELLYPQAASYYAGNGIVDREKSSWFVSGSSLYRITVDGFAAEQDGLDLHRVVPSDFHVTVVFQDRDGSIWLGSDGRGLMRLQPRFQFLVERRGNIVPMEDGSYWTITLQAQEGTRNLQRWHNDRVVEELPLTGVDDISAAQNGGIWIKHRKGGIPSLARYSNGSLERFVWPTSMVPDLPIREDRQGQIWQREAPNARTSRAFKDGQVVATVPGIFFGATSAGVNWFRLRNGNLGRFQGGQMQEFKLSGDGDAELRSLYEDRSGRIWVSTYGNGLWCIHNNQTTRMTTEQGLPHNMLGEIVEDEFGRLWINSNKGLFVAFLNDLVRATNTGATAPCYMITDIEMGAPRIQRHVVNPMVFSTIEGAMRIQPSTVPALLPSPQARVEQIGSTTLSSARHTRLELPLGERNIRFEFTAPYLLPIGGPRFRYRLVGVDPDWVEAGERRETFYGQLPPGEYTFEVMARSPTGVPGEPDAITVTLPFRFYETPIFKGIVALVLGAFVLAVVATQVKMILAQKRAMNAEEEARRQRDQLARVSRVATLGELTTTIAHEVNQPLSAVVSNAQAALRIMDAPNPDLQEVRAALTDIATGGNMAADVISRVRSLVGKKAVRSTSVDINEVVRIIVDLVRPEMQKRGIMLRTEFANDLPRASGDSVELQQVLLNLLNNGAQAMKDVASESSVLTVRTGVDESGPVVSVTDLGVGLDDEIREQMFEPFFTTKSKGMGMGLSINRTIIEAHGGRIWATPNPEGGTTFFFTIPPFDAGTTSIQKGEA